MTKEIETMKLALEHAKRDERHMNYAETRNWCRMYRDMAEKAVEALAEQPAQHVLEVRVWRDKNHDQHAEFRGYDKLPDGEHVFYTSPQPAQQEPFGYFKAEPFGWTDCAETDEGAIALYEHPQPAQPDYQALEPALTRLQKRYADLEGKVNRPWVGLTDEERNHARQTVTYSQLAMTAGEWAEKVQIETERRLKEKNT